MHKQPVEGGPIHARVKRGAAVLWTESMMRCIPVIQPRPEQAWKQGPRSQVRNDWLHPTYTGITRTIWTRELLFSLQALMSSRL